MTRQSRRQPDRDAPGRPGDAVVKGLRALDRRDRSSAELTQWLAAREFSADEIEAAIGRLAELGALNDERFAFCFAADKRELAGWGQERITATLIERGIDRELAERAGGEGHGEQTDRATRLLGERGETLEDESSKARALGFLTRRGFAYEIAYEAIREAADGQR